MVEYVYDAWGNHKIFDVHGVELNDEDNIGYLNPFRYRGYYYDKEFDLYYLKTRYYSPALCRFINADSIDYADPETINGLNLYAYCNNNPVMRVDPTGEFGLTISFLIGLAISVASCIVGGVFVGGVSAAVNGENIWAGIGNGAIVGLLIGLSIVVTSFGLSSPLSGTSGGAALRGGGVGSLAALYTNLEQQLKNGGFGSLDFWQYTKAWGIGLAVGAVAGAAGHILGKIGEYYGGMLGLTLAGKTFLGVTISKIISTEFLFTAISFLGGGLAGFLGGFAINNLATDSQLQEENVPLWLATILKFLFGKL